MPLYDIKIENLAYLDRLIAINQSSHQKSVKIFLNLYWLKHNLSNYLCLILFTMFFPAFGCSR